MVATPSEARPAYRGPDEAMVGGVGHPAPGGASTTEDVAVGAGHGGPGVLAQDSRPAVPTFCHSLLYHVSLLTLKRFVNLLQNRKVLTQ